MNFECQKFLDVLQKSECHKGRRYFFGEEIDKLENEKN